MSSDANPDVKVMVTRSAGDDRAVVVFIDTSFEPNGSDGGPGLRVLINDAEAYAWKVVDGLDAEHLAGTKTLTVSLKEVAYLNESTPEVDR